MKVPQFGLGLFLVAALAALPSSAQNIKPGLWEVNTKMKSGDGQMEQALSRMQSEMAKMPPEQRKMMEDMMAKQGVAMAGNVITAKVCMTKDMIARGQMPVQHEGNCTTRRESASGNTVRWSMSCPKATGSGEMTMSGDSAYHMTMNMTSTETGKPHNMNMDMNGKWIGADCPAKTK